MVFFYGDLWAFKRSTREWAWMSGPTSNDEGGSCGTKGYFGQDNYPGSRITYNLVFHLASRYLVLFGGQGYPCEGEFGPLSETWVYSVDSNQWAWISGGGPNSSNDMTGQFVSTSAYSPDAGACFFFGGRFYIPATNVDGELDLLWSADILIDRVAIKPSSTATSQQSSTNSQRSSSLQNVLIPTSSTLPTSFSAIQQSLSLQEVLSSSNDVLSSFLPPSGTSLSDFPSISPTLSQLRSNSTSSSARKSNQSLFSSQLSISRKRQMGTNDSNETKPLLSKLWSLRIYLLMILLLLIFLLGNLLLVKWIQTRRRKAKSLVEEVTVATSSHTLTLASNGKSTSSTGQATLEGSSASGIYLPGGLQVDGNSAYRMEKELARGGGGRVSIATAFEEILKQYGSKVIVKIPNSTQMDERALGLFHQEIALMNAFKRHKNIAKLLGYSENPYAIVLKYYSHGSLKKWILAHPGKRKLAFAFMQDISTGISILHSSGIVHCDLKPDNVLLDKQGSRLFAVITDFGIARVVTDALLKVEAYQVKLINGVSPAYAAPEAIKELRKSQPR
eukprot:Partr_v1_DN28146_c1_g1_i1_m55315 putative protein kinase kinase kinase